MVEGVWWRVLDLGCMGRRDRELNKRGNEESERAREREKERGTARGAGGGVSHRHSPWLRRSRAVHLTPCPSIHLLFTLRQSFYSP